MLSYIIIGMLLNVVLTIYFELCRDHPSDEKVLFMFLQMIFVVMLWPLLLLAIWVQEIKRSEAKRWYNMIDSMDKDRDMWDLTDAADYINQAHNFEYRRGRWN